MIKHSVIKNIAKKGSVTCKELQQFIWKAQGRDPKLFYNRPGNYGNGIRDWVDQGLIRRESRGVYAITLNGKKYAQNPKHIKTIKIEAQIESLKRRIKSVVNENKNLRKHNAEMDRVLCNIKDYVTRYPTHRLHNVDI
tara:strand:+ start:3426 stop:3839 length:414 start_codon:yes stop_codon:yes gene_type:complete